MQYSDAIRVLVAHKAASNQARCSSANTDLSKPSLVDQLLDCLEARVPPGNVWLNTTQHVHSGLVELQQHTLDQHHPIPFQQPLLLQ